MLSVRLLAAILLAAAPAALPAQSGTADPDDTGGIATAQREFQALRNAEKIQADEHKLRLPDVTAPELRPTTPPAAGPNRDRDQTGLITTRKKKSDNWLVDAMMKEPEDPDAPKAWSEEEAEPEHLRDPFAVLIAETVRPKPKGEADDTAGKDSKPDTRVVDAPNPFAAYMSAWISPQHRELLAPSWSDGGPVPSAAGPSPVPGGSPAGPTTAQPAGGGEGWRSLPVPGESGPAFNAAGNQTNPFLPADDFRPPVMLPVPPSAPAPAPMPPPVEPPRSRTEPPPVLNQPADDAKYFPQLKRF